MISAIRGARTTQATSFYWIYQYDTLSQITSGKRSLADGTPVAGQQFEYGFDDIGNPQTAAHGGNATQSPGSPVTLSSVRNGGEPRTRCGSVLIQEETYGRTPDSGKIDWRLKRCKPTTYECVS